MENINRRHFQRKSLITSAATIFCDYAFDKQLRSVRSKHGNEREKGQAELMKAVNIEDVLHARPFRPFTVETDNGKKIPEFVHVRNRFENHA